MSVKLNITEITVDKDSDVEIVRINGTIHLLTRNGNDVYLYTIGEINQLLEGVARDINDDEKRDILDTVQRFFIMLAENW